MKQILMKSVVSFRFYSSLNDFFPAGKGNTDISYAFVQAPSVKDAIEAIGVPHPEVHVILVNNTIVSFDYLLKHGDKVDVYPLPLQTDNTDAIFPSEKRFVLDVHLGKLAKALRMLGFDALYENDYDDRTIARIAEAEQRIVLTRDVGLLKQKAVKFGYWIRSQHLEEQLKEVIKHFRLKSEFEPLSRCLVCNSTIVLTDKEKVEDLLPPKTKLYFQDFFQCPDCQRVYWKGSHYERMKAFVKDIVSY